MSTHHHTRLPCLALLVLLSTPAAGAQDAPGSASEGGVQGGAPPEEVAAELLREVRLHADRDPALLGREAQVSETVRPYPMLVLQGAATLLAEVQLRQAFRMPAGHAPGLDRDGLLAQLDALEAQYTLSRQDAWTRLNASSLPVGGIEAEDAIARSLPVLGLDNAHRFLDSLRRHVAQHGTVPEDALLRLLRSTHTTMILAERFGPPQGTTASALDIDGVRAVRMRTTYALDTRDVNVAPHEAQARAALAAGHLQGAFLYTVQAEFSHVGAQVNQEALREKRDMRPDLEEAVQTWEARQPSLLLDQALANGRLALAVAGPNGTIAANDAAALAAPALATFGVVRLLRSEEASVSSSEGAGVPFAGVLAGVVLVAVAVYASSYRKVRP